MVLMILLIVILSDIETLLAELAHFLQVVSVESRPEILQFVDIGKNDELIVDILLDLLSF